MRSSIRNQILVPLVAVQVVMVATIALVAARLATGRVEAQVTGRLEGVVETLGRSNFPLTGGVLDKMRGLSGAHFVSADEAGRILESTLPNLQRLPPTLRNMPDRTSLDPPGSSPKVDVGGFGYFATSIRSTSGSSLLILYPEAAWRRARWDATLPTLALGALSLIPMALMTGMVAHRLSGRLRSVEANVAAIAAGDLRELEGRPLGDEVDDLIRSVNQMTSQLRRLRETIRGNERAAVLAQLAAGLAHQLRNAATGAKMAVQLHARRCPGSESDGSLDVALRQLALCESQIKGMLTMGQLPGDRETLVDPAAIVDEVCRLVEPTCRHIGLSLTCQVEASRAIRGDGDRLQAALLNLVLNAIEAAGPEGNVRIEVSEEERICRFDVIDDGVGPPLELASTLFEPFVTTKTEGLGLGLALANRVASDHGGGLSWSRVDGKTIFSMKLANDRLEEPTCDGPDPGDR
jgi:signal transduction histidine kinase